MEQSAVLEFVEIQGQRRLLVNTLKAIGTFQVHRDIVIDRLAFAHRGVDVDSLRPLLLPNLVVISQDLHAFAGNFNLQNRNRTGEELVADFFVLGQHGCGDGQAEDEGRCGSWQHCSLRVVAQR